MFTLFALAACSPDPLPDSSAEPLPIEDYDPLQYVDPFIGTGGIGAQVANVNPGASLPFGMTLVGPDSAANYGAPGFYHCAGYHWPDTFIMGFSHTHAHGMGVTDFGAVQVMPADGWAQSKAERSGRKLEFSHDNEWATPGWYAVDLEGGLHAEIAATERGAAHRYSFPPGADPVLIVDLGFALGEDDVAEGRATVDLDAATLHGFQRLLGSYSERFGGLQTYFAARMDPAPVAAGSWVDGVAGEALSIEGTDVGVWLQFPEGTEVVQLDLAVSYVDEVGAQGNLDAELPLFDLDAVALAGTEAWRAELSNVRVRGADAEMRIFHTAQYHSMLMPSLNQDVDGRYRAFDNTIRSIDHDYYSDFSLWDTFRTLHPWLLLTRPDRERDMVRSLIRMADDGGSLPRWPLAHGYTGGMVGTPAIQVMAEAALKGLEGFDEPHALDLALTAALEGQPDAGRSGHDAYRELGFVSFEAAGSPASRTLEYAWSDHALGLWAREAGRAEAAIVEQMAGNWANTFDSEQGFFIGRYADGSFEPMSAPEVWVDSFTEGNAWHYRWGAPWDPEGMLELTHGGDVASALAELETYWDAVEAEVDDDFPDDFYWHGNEPDLHYAMVPAMFGDRALTARAIELVRETRYDDTERGLDGNDDGGTLSAWYLFQAMGVYPIAGTPDYVAGNPSLERTEIDIAGKTLVVDARGAGVAATVRVGESEVDWRIPHGAWFESEQLTFER